MTPDGHRDTSAEYTNPATVILCAVTAGIVALAVGSGPALLMPGPTGIGFWVGAPLALIAYAFTYLKVKRKIVRGGQDG